MKLPSYLGCMAIRINCKRLVLYSSVVVLSICTAVKCKKDDFVYDYLDRIEGSKVWVSLLPEKANYKVGDIITIEGSFFAKDFQLENFSVIENDPWVKDFEFYDVTTHKIQSNSYSIVQDSNLRIETFSPDRSSYRFKRSYRLERAGRFHIDHGVENAWNNTDAQGNRIYSTLSITILSGKRKPRGYRTDAIMYFTNNDKTFIEIEVVE